MKNSVSFFDKLVFFLWNLFCIAQGILCLVIAIYNSITIEVTKLRVFMGIVGFCLILVQLITVPIINRLDSLNNK